MSSSSIEMETDADRFAELRAAVTAIRQHNAEQGRPTNAVSGHTSSEWLERAVGLFEGNVAFEEAVRYGEAWRNGDLRERDEE